MCWSVDTECVEVSGCGMWWSVDIECVEVDGCGVSGYGVSRSECVMCDAASGCEVWYLWVSSGM